MKSTCSIRIAVLYRFSRVYPARLVSMIITAKTIKYKDCQQCLSENTGALHVEEYEGVAMKPQATSSWDWSIISKLIALNALLRINVETSSLSQSISKTMRRSNEDLRLSSRRSYHQTHPVLRQNRCALYQTIFTSPYVKLISNWKAILAAWKVRYDFACETGSDVCDIHIEWQEVYWVVPRIPNVQRRNDCIISWSLHNFRHKISPKKIQQESAGRLPRVD